MATKRNKLLKVLEVLSADKNSVDFSQLDSEIDRLKNALKEKVQAKTLEDVSIQLEKFKKKLDFNSLFEAIGNLETALDQKIKGVTGLLSNETSTLKKLLASNEASAKDQISTIASNIKFLEEETKRLSIQRDVDLAGIRDKIERLLDSSLKTSDSFLEVDKRFNVIIEKDKEVKDKIDELAGFPDKLRKEFNNKLSNLGGGQANRQINIKSSVMSTRYNDINFKNGGGIVWTSADDNVNKRVDITASITASGGGGSGNPAGNDTEIQYNDGGSFGGASVLTFNKNSSVFSANNLDVYPGGYAVINGTTPQLDLYESDRNEFGGIYLQSGRLHLYTAASSIIAMDNDFRFSSGGVIQLNGSSWNGPLVPDTHDSYDLGTSSTAWAGLYLGPDEVIHFNGIEYIYQGVGTNNNLYLTAPTGSIVGVVASAFEVGQQGSVTGVLRVAGRTSGAVNIQVPSTVGTWTMTLPANDGGAGQYLLTDGNGITQWASVTASGGSGIVRSSSIITEDTTGGTTGSTDYVYFVNDGIRFTLPAAVGNTNLYTVKNMAASSVLVVSGEGIDGSATALMPTQYESLSFISNQSIWGVI